MIETRIWYRRSRACSLDRTRQENNRVEEGHNLSRYLFIKHSIYSDTRSLRCAEPSERRGYSGVSMGEWRFRAPKAVETNHAHQRSLRTKRGTVYTIPTTIVYHLEYHNKTQDIMISLDGLYHNIACQTFEGRTSRPSQLAGLSQGAQYWQSVRIVGQSSWWIVDWDVIVRNIWLQVYWVSKNILWPLIKVRHSLKYEQMFSAMWYDTSREVTFLSF